MSTGKNEGLNNITIPCNYLQLAQSVRKLALIKGGISIAFASHWLKNWHNISKCSNAIRWLPPTGIWKYHNCNISPWRTHNQAFWRGAPLLRSVTIKGHVNLYCTGHLNVAFRSNRIIWLVQTKVSFQLIWFEILQFLWIVPKWQRAVFKFNFGATGRNSLYTTLWQLLVYFKFLWQLKNISTCSLRHLFHI